MNVFFRVMILIIMCIIIYIPAFAECNGMDEVVDIPIQDIYSEEVIMEEIIDLPVPGAMADDIIMDEISDMPLPAAGPADIAMDEISNASLSEKNTDIAVQDIKVPEYVTPSDIILLPDAYPEAPEGFLPVFSHRITTDPVVAITIDDCNQPGNLSEMIGIISSVGGHATIFPIGINVPRLSHILTDAVNAGHELGNHTMEHSGIYWEDDEGIAYQIWQQDHEIDTVLGYDYRIRFFRPRGGDNRYDQRTHAYIRQMGYSGIAYWSQVGSGNTAYSLMANLQPGDVMLFHTTDQDLQVIRELVPLLDRKGYRLVTLSELFILPENSVCDLRDTETPMPLLPYVRFDQMLKRGDYLHDVYLMQEKLTYLGYLSCEYNGYFGLNTENALKAFQADIGLNADGQCDPLTWQALFSK